MTEDQEIRAMAKIAKALEGLEDEAVGRVVRWAADRFGVSVRQSPESDHDIGSGEDRGRGEQEFEDFADLYDAASPQTDVDRALVGAYWIQVVGGAPDFQSQPVNSALKDLGHGVNDITTAFSGLMEQEPRLVMQKQKKGSTRQARKVYKLTRAGERQVEEMIGGTRSEA